MPWIHRVLRGLPGRDEQIENYGQTLRNMAAAGIYLLGYHFMAGYVWRTAMTAVGRGNARVTAFDLADVSAGNALARYKLDAGRADRAAAVHRGRLGQPQLLPGGRAAGRGGGGGAAGPASRRPAGRRPARRRGPDLHLTGRAAARVRERGRQPGLGPQHVPGHDLGDGRAGGGRARSSTSSVRAGRSRTSTSATSSAPCRPSARPSSTRETSTSPAVVTRLVDVGFTGFIIDDHVPAMVDDIDTWGDTSSEAYCSRGRAHAIGYLQGVLDAVLAARH